MKAYTKARKAYEIEFAPVEAEFLAVLDEYCPSRDADIAAAEAEMDAAIKAATEKFKAVRAARMEQFNADIAEQRDKHDAAREALYIKHLEGVRI